MSGVYVAQCSAPILGSAAIATKTQLTEAVADPSIPLSHVDRKPVLTANTASTTEIMKVGNLGSVKKKRRNAGFVGWFHGSNVQVDGMDSVAQALASDAHACR
jgi:hypothetical protein